MKFIELNDLIPGISMEYKNHIKMRYHYEKTIVDPAINDHINFLLCI